MNLATSKINARSLLELYPAIGLKCPIPVWPSVFLWKFIVKNRFDRRLHAIIEFLNRFRLDSLRTYDWDICLFSKGEKAIDLA